MSNPPRLSRRSLLALFTGLPALAGFVPRGLAGPRDQGIGGTGSSVTPEESEGDRGIGGTGVIGTIRRFGSIVVNGLRIAYPQDATVRIDGVAATPTSLKIGQVVRVVAVESGGQLSTQTINVTSEAVGRVEKTGARSLTVLGQSVSLGSLSRAQGRFAVGDDVAVSGLRRPDGVIVASLIERRHPGIEQVAGPVTIGADGSAMVGGLKLSSVDPSLIGQRAVLRGRLADAAFEVLQGKSESTLLGSPGEVAVRPPGAIFRIASAPRATLRAVPSRHRRGRRGLDERERGQMKTRWATVAVVGGLLATVISMSAGPAAADDALPGDQAACGTYQVPITTDVRLTHDVSCSNVFLGRSVTIDLAGHTLQAHTLVATALPVFDVTITSGRLLITDLSGVSLHLRQVRESGGIRGGSVSLERSSVDGDVVIMFAGRISVVDSALRGSVQGEGGPLTVRHSIVTGNVLTTNTEAGVGFAVDHSLFGGSLTIHLGVAFPPGDVEGDIAHNIFVGGGIRLAGFAMISLGPTTITDNVVVRSAGSGIQVDSGDIGNPTPSGPVTLRGNLAIANQGHGIDVGPVGATQPQVIDGGHNRAILNGTDPQCVGVSCRPFA